MPRPPDEIIQETVLHWLSEFILFAQEVMLPATPSLIPAILPNLAHPFAAIQAAAGDTNLNLYRLIKSLPSPAATTSAFLQSPTAASESPSAHGSHPPPVAVPTPLAPRRNSAQAEGGDPSSKDVGQSGLTSSTSTIKPRDLAAQPPAPAPPPIAVDGPSHASKASTSTLGSAAPVTPNALTFPSMPSVSGGLSSMAEEDPFDYQATVNVLTLQFLSEYEDTRIAALEWLIMLQQKAPKKVRRRRAALT